MQAFACKRECVKEALGKSWSKGGGREPGEGKREKEGVEGIRQGKLMTEDKYVEGRITRVKIE